MEKELFYKAFTEFIKEMKIEFDKVFDKKIEGIREGRKIRGNNPSLSHILEDKFTDFLSALYPSDKFIYLIDVSLSTKLNNETETIRPDIVMVDKSSKTIRAIFELKIDDARAKENWVQMAEDNIKRLKKISINRINNPKENFIKYRTIKLDTYGNPCRSKTGKLQFDTHFLTCHTDAKVACFTLCEENSRKNKDGKMRTSGCNATYISVRHFNNQNHALEDFLREDNLYSEKVFQILNGMNLG